MRVEAQLARDERDAGPVRSKRTIWQATGVHRGETELEIARRERQNQLVAVQQAIARLQHASFPPETLLERYGTAVNVVSAALLGFVYGSLRAYVRGYWQDVTPSVCRELSLHIGKRTMLGCALFVCAYEAAPWVKQQVLQKLDMSGIKSYKEEKALEQLMCIDAAYIGLLAVLNFAFPYVLVPVAFNPTQLLTPPSDCCFPHPQSR